MFDFFAVAFGQRFEAFLETLSTTDPEAYAAYVDHANTVAAAAYDEAVYVRDRLRVVSKEKYLRSFNE